MQVGPTEVKRIGKGEPRDVVKKAVSLANSGAPTLRELSCLEPSSDPLCQLPSPVLSDRHLPVRGKKHRRA